MPRARRAADVLLLAVLVTATWHRVAWQPFGRVTLADLLAPFFVAAVALSRPRVRREARTLAMIGAGLAVVYLAGAIFTADRGQLGEGPRDLGAVVRRRDRRRRSTCRREAGRSTAGR